MAGRRRTGSFWPSPEQEQLLAVALGQPGDAVAAWARLRPTFDLDRLERGSFTLLPLVYRALADGGSDDPLLPRLKGIYRSTWVKNNLLLERTRDTHDVIAAAGVRALFVGGVTTSAYYAEIGLRPTPHLDVLIDADAATAVRARLPRARWHLRDGGEAGPTGPWLFSDPDGHLCLLRTSIAFDFELPGDAQRTNEPLWEAAERYDARGEHVLVPSVTDALLAICVGGARRGPIPNVQWIADAVMILRRAGDRIDWERLVHLGTERQQALRLRNAFACVATQPGAAVPPAVTAGLDARRAGWRERTIYAAASGSLPGPGAMPLIVAEHLVATTDRSVTETVGTFPRHLRTRWGLASYRQLPRAAARRAVRMVGLGRNRTA